MKTNKRIITCLITVVTVMLITFTAGLKPIRTAAENDLSDMTKCYASVEISSGDTLWSISRSYAEKYGISTDDYAKELRKVNALTSDRITAGTHLIVVYWE